MKISVITVVRNQKDTLGHTIRSVNTQTYPNIEHIVVDGNSDDGTDAVIEHYRPVLHQVLCEPDQGTYDAMNKGIAMATGDVIGFLNADDFYAHERVVEHIAESLDDPRVDACYADIQYVKSTDLDHVVRYWRSGVYRPGAFERGWMPAHPTFYVRSEVYRRLGDFKLDYRLQSDFELTARFIAVNGIATRYVPEVWVKMRLGGATNRSIGNIIRGNLESYRACKKLGLKMTPLYFLTKFMMRIPQFFRH